MKLCRFGPLGAERPGLIDSQGQLRDLSSVVDDIDQNTLTPAGLAKLAAVDIQALPVIQDPVRYGVPLAHIPNLIGIGLNYSDHAHETNTPIPSEPIVFNKHTGSLCGAQDAVFLPQGSTHLDWEVELAFVIGTPCWHVNEADALKYIAGYTVVNDISERHYQMHREGQWTKGKSHPGFAPIGPWIVTSDEIDNVQNLDLWLDLNGKRMQTGSTNNMIFNCAFLVSYLSQFMALKPGDVVTTGTPPGVGVGKKPPQFLQAGDVMRLGISHLGEQESQVVALTDEMVAVWRNAQQV